MFDPSKGESIWDRFTHSHPELVRDHSNGDVACDTYHEWREDIEILKDLGVDFHRFSLSWPRILPDGFARRINPDGVRFYNDFINKLLKNNIEPLVTLYHWDLPQRLQDLGGWTNPDMAVYFEEYAKIAFELFGDRVKRWITINEPHSFCEFTYGYGHGAPHIFSPGIGDYLCGKTVLIAHARAYHLYQREFKKSQGGKIGISLDTNWAEPMTNSTEDIKAAERQLEMEFGWWANPIFSNTGDYPEVMKQRVDERSRLENFTISRLPALTTDEIKMIKGTADFLGLNHYHTWLVGDHDFPIDGEPSHEKDMGIKSRQDPNWKPSPQIVPWGFRKLMNWIKEKYNNPLVYITENGYGDISEALEDHDRVTQIKLFIQAVMDAVEKDGCNVKRYTYWSTLDNMEWSLGYTVKFGLYHVDFTSPNRTRTPKLSAKTFKDIIRKRQL
ncbi:unnamed protein product [Acanthoscelides obtectus]|uniref:Beta-glucosidase n=1 Tax=Acanthoscelides obtectus TaxID=200917 RepID=A0A9P0LKE0_ACAOB|nr:unnamed protein product [Acanthoscelides obtectus]CAK1663884.1 hypothetical protein AOBTE_LOCUS23915 [Acanthoscelides obtectus]